MTICEVKGCDHLVAPDDKCCPFCANAIRRQEEAAELSERMAAEGYSPKEQLHAWFDHLAPMKPEVPVSFATDC